MPRPDPIAPSEGATPLPDPYAPDAPTSAVALPTGPVMEHPHPLTPVIKGWMGLVGLAIYFGKDALEHLGRRGDDGSTPTLFGINAGFWIIGGVLLAYLLLTGVIGFFQWRTTRFVIDDEQVRVEHNFIWRTSDRVPFTKVQSVDVVQPFAARLLGLAQLRIDVGSGHAKTIEYLPRERAYQLRDYLVTRAHGRVVGLAEHSSTRAIADRLHDLAADERVLLRVPASRLVLATLLSAEFLLTALVGITGLVASLWSGEFGATAGMVPLALGLVGMVTTNVVKQWNYSLVRSGQALKVSRGMTSLVSQTLPTNRVQGLSITQHLAWRPLGIFRVRMDVLGYGDGDEEDRASDLLLPAGTWADVLVALEAVWPGFRIEEVAMHPAPARARWLHPFAWRWLAWGSTPEVMVARHGALVRRTELVHHARVQSAALAQGPLQRRLHLADVALHTTKGPVDLVAAEIDEQVARGLVLDEMERCRQARRLDAGRTALAGLPAPEVGAHGSTD